jgi:hypothetical protein
MKFWLGRVGARCPRQDITSLFDPLVSLFPTGWWQLATLETCPIAVYEFVRKMIVIIKIMFLTALHTYRILVFIYQLDAKFLYSVIYMYYIKYLDMFRAILCSSSGGQNYILQHLVSSLSESGRVVHLLKMSIILFET